MQPPIFIDNNGDLVIFRSVESAQSYIEPEDAADSRTRLYDSEGRMLTAIHEPPDMWFARNYGLPGRKMRIVQVEDEPSHSDELRDKLLYFLKYVKYPDEQLQGKPLSQLVELSLAHATE